MIEWAWGVSRTHRRALQRLRARTRSTSSTSPSPAVPTRANGTLRRRVRRRRIALVIPEESRWRAGSILARDVDPDRNRGSGRGPKARPGMRRISSNSTTPDAPKLPVIYMHELVAMVAPRAILAIAIRASTVSEARPAPVSMKRLPSKCTRRSASPTESASPKRRLPVIAHFQRARRKSVVAFVEKFLRGNHERQHRHRKDPYTTNLTRDGSPGARRP